MVRITRMRDGSSVGVAVLEVTAVPQAELLNQNPEKAHMRNQELFLQTITGFHRRSQHNLSSIEILWQSIPTEYPAGAARVRQFLVVRQMGKSPQNLINDVTCLWQSLTGELCAQGFDLKLIGDDAAYDEFLSSLKYVNTEAVVALSKKERYAQSVLLPNSCLYYTDVVSPSAGRNMSALVRELESHPNSAVSLQLIPTDYVSEELAGIEQGRKDMGYYIHNMRYRQEIHTSTGAQAITDSYNYLFASGKEPLFYYNFVIYSDPASAGCLAGALADVVEERGRENSAFETVNLGGCGLEPGRQFAAQPWILSNLLVFERRDASFWNSQIAPRCFLRLNYLATAKEISGVFQLPMDERPKAGQMIPVEPEEESTEPEVPEEIKEERPEEVPEEMEEETSEEDEISEESEAIEEELPVEPEEEISEEEEDEIPEEPETIGEEIPVEPEENSAEPEIPEEIKEEPLEEVPEEIEEEIPEDPEEPEEIEEEIPAEPEEEPTEPEIPEEIEEDPPEEVPEEKEKEILEEVPEEIEEEIPEEPEEIEEKIPAEPEEEPTEPEIPEEPEEETPEEVPEEMEEEIPEEPEEPEKIEEEVPAEPEEEPAEPEVPEKIGEEVSEEIEEETPEEPEEPEEIEEEIPVEPEEELTEPEAPVEIEEETQEKVPEEIEEEVPAEPEEEATEPEIPEEPEEEVTEPETPEEVPEEIDCSAASWNFPSREEVYASEEYAEAVNRSLERFEKAGCRVLRIENHWSDENNPWKGINVRLVSPDGEKIRVGYHTRESKNLQNGDMRRLYEQWESLPEDSMEAIELQNHMFVLSRQLKIPRNISEVRTS